MVQMRVEAKFTKDTLQGDEVTEIRWGWFFLMFFSGDIVSFLCIRLELKGMIEERMGDEYKED